MIFKQKLIPFFILLSGFCGDLLHSENHPLLDDQQALEYCRTASHSYVAIVWPLGIDDLKYVISTLSKHAEVKYVKQFTLEKKETFSLYRKLHKSMSYTSSKKYFKPYITSALHEPFHLAAIVFHTDEELDIILSWKKKIRDHIGQSYYSIHINDRCQPETFEAAQAVFKDIAEGGSVSC